jgi:hypothetical protein
MDKSTYSRFLLQSYTYYIHFMDTVYFTLVNLCLFLVRSFSYPQPLPSISEDHPVVISICHIFFTVLWCFTKVLNLSILIGFTDYKWKINIFAKSIITVYYWLIDFLDHPAVLFAELTPFECCNSSAIPEPATKNKLHMDSSKTNDLMILSLLSNICRVGMVISPIYIYFFVIGCKSFVWSLKLKNLKFWIRSHFVCQFISHVPWNRCIVNLFPTILQSVWHSCPFSVLN